MNLLEKFSTDYPELLSQFYSHQNIGLLDPDSLSYALFLNWYDGLPSEHRAEVIRYVKEIIYTVMGVTEELQKLEGLLERSKQ